MRGYGAGKFVGIRMEESNIRKLIKKAVESRSTDLEAIKVDGSKSYCRLVVWWFFTEEPSVTAYI